MNLLNRVPCVPVCQRGLRANVPACQCGLRANVPEYQRGLRVSVLVCQRGLRANIPKACKLHIFTCQRAIRCANVSTWHASVPEDVAILQFDVATCQKGCTFFEHSSYEMIREISIHYHYT